MLDYPIATFLFWRVDASNVTDDTTICRFRYDVTFKSNKTPADADYKLEDININITDTAILDGQQRLTSLFLSLFGDIKILPKHAKQKTGVKSFTKLLVELNKNKISVDEEEYNSMKFDIKFCVGKLSPTQFDIKSILDARFRSESTKQLAIDEAIVNVPIDWLNKNFKYEQDHLHPDNGFDMVQKPLSISMEDWKKWRSNRNRLPNLQLLVGRANASKSDKRLIDYYNDMNDEQKGIFHKEAMIPEDISLSIEDFDKFYDERKKLVIEKIRILLG